MPNDVDSPNVETVPDNFSSQKYSTTRLHHATESNTASNESNTENLEW